WFQHDADIFAAVSLATRYCTPKAALKTRSPAKSSSINAFSINAFSINAFSINAFSINAFSINASHLVDTAIRTPRKFG
ncbi:hypothetical protein N9B98_04270, partial [bacterium]|nr:hypothetical protein [bacterium]